MKFKLVLKKNNYQTDSVCILHCPDSRVARDVMSRLLHEAGRITKPALLFMPVQGKPDFLIGKFDPNDLYHNCNCIQVF